MAGRAKTYPLTPAQKLHFFSLEHCPRKSLSNIGTSVTLDHDVDWNVLKEAIYKAYERCESMRLRLKKNSKGETVQYIVPKETREIEYRSFENSTMEEAKKVMTEWTSTPFELYDSPLNRIVMINMPDGYKGMYLLVHHMTMDAQSLVLFFADILQLYCSMKFPESVEAPGPLSSYVEQLKKDLKYEGSKAQERDRKYIYDLLESSEPIYADVDGKAPMQELREKTGNPNLRAMKRENRTIEATIDKFHLEGDPSARLMNFCEKNRIPMVCLLLLGLRTYFQKFNEIDDISINTAIARRATLAEKNSGGTRIHCFAFRTVISRDTTFMDALHEIQYQQSQLFRHANFDPVEAMRHRGEYFAEKSMGGTYEPMALTYQPLTLKAAKNKYDVPYKTDWYTNGVAAQELYLTVMHRVDDDGLDFNFEYQKAHITYEKLERFYYYLCRILFRGVQDPNKTIGEIIDEV